MSGAKRILMLTSQHSPFDGRVFHLEAKALRDAGHQVTIVAERKGDHQGVVDGIRIITYRKAKPGPLRKLSTLRALVRAAGKIDTDVLHVHEVDAPLMAAAWAKHRAARAGKTVKLVFDSHEVWPFFFAAKFSGKCMREITRHAVVAYETWMLHHAVDAVITAHELEENYYRWLNPWVPVRKVLGGPPISQWPAPPERSGPLEVIGHDGYFTLQRGLDILLGAFEIIARDYPAVRLLAAGDFMTDADREYFDSWCARTGLRDRVETAGWVDRSGVVVYLDRMDIGIVANRGDIHSIRCWPANKMMYYLGRGVPVVSTPTPLYRLHLERIGCGLAADDFSPGAMAKAMRRMLDNPEETREMGRRGYETALKEYNWEVSRQELLKVYDELEK